MHFMDLSITKKIIFAAIVAGASAACALAGEFQPTGDPLDLAGKWQVVLRAGAKPFAWDDSLSAQPVQLPGSLQVQGLGDEVSVKTQWTGQIVDYSWFTMPVYEKYRQPGNIKIPFWLQPYRHFVGAAAYRRQIEIPAHWQGKRCVLSLERVHISSRIWLDGKELGADHSLSTPHRYDLGHVTPGYHMLVICVDNHLPAAVGENAHCVSDHMQTNWNGIIGKIQLEATPDTCIDDLQTYADVAARQVTVNWSLGGQASGGKMAFVVRTPDHKTLSATAEAAAGQHTIALGETIHTWDEFSPNLYQLRATLTLPGGITHVAATRFGMVNYQVDGKRFLVNGRPTIFRGTLDCAMFPLTGYPSTDVDYWKKEIRAVKAHGFNHLRFHSWCPPEAAFNAADELGCYLQIEHAWTDPAQAGDYLMGEAERVIRSYAVCTSTDGKSWSLPIAQGEFPDSNARQTILFPRPIKTRFLKLVAISPFDVTKPYATVAELQPIVEGESN